MCTRLRYVWRSCALLAALLALPAAAVGQVKIEPATFGGLRARPIGPSVMSGRRIASSSRSSAVQKRSSSLSARSSSALRLFGMPGFSFSMMRSCCPSQNW